MSHFVLVPGLWLDASSWSAVLPHLESAGHTVTPLTLPGNRETTLPDWVDAVTEAIDAAPGPVILVGHSAGCGLAYAAADTRPVGIKRLVLIGGFPLPDGMPLLNAEFPAAEGYVPLPNLSVFSDEDLAGLDDAARAAFRRDAVPVPERVLAGTIKLRDDRRLQIPVTAICTEYSATDLQSLAEEGFAPTTELPRLDVSYVDLPTGHWPQFSRPSDLAQVLLDTA